MNRYGVYHYDYNRFPRLRKTPTVVMTWTYTNTWCSCFPTAPSHDVNFPTNYSTLHSTACDAVTLTATGSGSACTYSPKLDALIGAGPLAPADIKVGAGLNLFYS